MGYANTNLIQSHLESLILDPESPIPAQLPVYWQNERPTNGVHKLLTKKEDNIPLHPAMFFLYQNGCSRQKM